MEEKSRAQELSVREISLIRELAQIRKEHKRELEYEKFDGYLKIYLCQIYRDSLKTYNNRAMRLLREECRHEFWASYEPASDNSGGKPENECWERCYPYSWESGLYLRFAEERSEVYCDYSVHR